MESMVLTAAALLPAVILCVYVFKYDKVEKEPVGLLIKLLLLGALSCFPAASIETFATDGIDGLFKGMEVTGFTVRLYKIIENFIGIALIEEGIKFFILHITTKDNKEFNCIFDGLIYAIFVSLGFAALENVFYVYDGGLYTAQVRGVFSVPVHMFFAVVMGYYYSEWHILDQAREIEESLFEKGLITGDVDFFSSELSMKKCLIVPVLLHGAYDYFCDMGTPLAILALVAMVMIMYFKCFNKIKSMSKSDDYTQAYAMSFVEEKYPELSDYFRTQTYYYLEEQTVEQVVEYTDESADEEITD